MTDKKQDAHADLMNLVHKFGVALSSRLATGSSKAFDDVDAFARKLTDRIAELEAENLKLEILCDATYVDRGADAYHHACEQMERYQEKRRKAGKEVGTTHSLCDGMDWVYGRLDELEAQLEAVGAGGVGAMMPRHAQPAPAVVGRDGWQMVPVTPTQEMIDNVAAFSTEDLGVTYRAMLAAAPQPQQIAEPASADEPGWLCEHRLYGTWFISRAAVIADWKNDQKQAYPDKPEAEPDAEAVGIWLNEQTSWVEIHHNGKQMKRPDIAAIEAAWLQSMKRDVDWPHCLRAVNTQEQS